MFLIVTNHQHHFRWAVATTRRTSSKASLPSRPSSPLSTSSEASSQSSECSTSTRGPTIHQVSPDLPRGSLSKISSKCFNHKFMDQRKNTDYARQGSYVQVSPRCINLCQSATVGSATLSSWEIF